MKFEWPWKRKTITIEKDLHSLEKQLAAVFKPVTPRPEFLADLRVKLVGEKKRKRFKLPTINLKTGLLVAGGVVSFAGLVVAGIRVIPGLFQKIQFNRQSQIEETQPQPVHA